MTLYKIKDWENLFETAETRKLKNLRWVPTPNKHDGLTYRRMVRQKNAARLFCAWNLILQLASKTQPMNRRGYLERDGIPLSPGDMADSTGFPADLFDEALSFFSSNGNSWLEAINKTPGSSPGEPGKNPGTPGSSPVEGRKEGMEGKNPPTPLKDGKQSLPYKNILYLAHCRDEVEKELAQYCNQLYRRRQDTKWTEKEVKAFRRIETYNEQDLEDISNYYCQTQFGRKDLLTFLNNFQVEIDRARIHKDKRK